MKQGEFFVTKFILPITYTLFFNKKLRSGPSTESFLASGDLEYSMFLNSFLTIFLK